MVVIGATCVLLLSVVSALQIWWAVAFAARYSHSTDSSPEQTVLPPATVLLCVRGNDPSLHACLSALLDLDYPDYSIRIVVDSDMDPAWDVFAGFRSPKLSIEILEERLSTCSLKVSGLLQAIARLDPSRQIVAFIDSDVIAYRNWLRDLVRPLNDPQVGATTGVRWYVPLHSYNWGTLVRSVWNAGSCPQMYALGIAWGGSMAMRAEIFRKTNLLARWSESLVEDTGMRPFLRSQGLRLCHVPKVVMVNHESVSLIGAFRFIRRQLLVARLYHDGWPVVLVVGLGFPLTALTALAVLLLEPDRTLAALLGLVLGCYGLAMGAVLSLADRRINQLAQSRGASPYPYSWKSLLAVPFVQALHLVCVAAASMARQIDWRGISYQLEGGGRVRLLEYRPYRQEAELAHSNVSLL